ncbi:PAS sensor-containing two-component system histidine kinase [Aliarcobacter faecis]|uniref:PAS domain-containing sensor histidine kinase n=1 Tax=Aliarcobacter faecis TaxID=1564138 RepID=UPI0004B74C52|nr:PAS domain-containing sensor histidine kinase [Aliarcobacter faecis]QKF73154.1 PAS sensor-containing two-component system histidine kinase [Aliarcobacter faecis]
MQEEFLKSTILFYIFFGIVIIFIYWIIKLRDETKKKQDFQRELELSEEKYRELFDIAPVLLNAFDENGKVVLWNKECEKVFGWTLEELQKYENPISLFYTNEEIQKELLASKMEKNEYKVLYPRRKDGKILVLKWTNITLPNGDIIHIGHDITEQIENEGLLKQNGLTLRFAKNRLEELNNSLEKRIKKEIEKSTKQQALLMQQSKLVQMGEMIQNIAHQWRQPLSQINSTLMLLDAYLNEKNCMDEKIEKGISQIEDVTSYLSHTIDDFQNFFNPNKQRTLFKISDAIQRALNIVQGHINLKNIEIVNNISSELEIYGQREELQQVLLVLINNAIDAFDMNNIVNSKIIFDMISKNNEVIIIVEDNALGIDEKIIERIFDPYFTTKYKSKGTGVGLYLAKMILQNSLNGDLSVENGKEGAKFKIKLGVKE